MEEETEAVKVFCRLKPSSNQNEEPCVFYEIKNREEFLRVVPPVGARRNAKESFHHFTRIFNEEIIQDDIYEEVAYPLVKDLIEGKNGLLFTYGVTGSGKTYTMQGNDNNPGLVPRALKSLFERINLVPQYRLVSNLRNGFKVVDLLDTLDMKAKYASYYNRRSGEASCVSYMKRIIDMENYIENQDNCAVFISVVELYGKCFTDLLATKSDPKKEITIKEDVKKQKYLYNVTEMEVRSAEEAFYFYMKANKNRKVECTKLNSESSRSHLILNIRLVTLNNNLGGESRNKTNALFTQRNCSNSAQCDVAIELTPMTDQHSNTCLVSDSGSEVGAIRGCNRTLLFRKDNDQMIVSQLSMVDLAGSERTGRAGTNGVRLKEACDINNALMVLRRCMEQLRDKNRNTDSKPDYRSNELTHLFKSCLEGGSALNMIVCVQSSADEYEETMNVLKFANSSQEISNPLQKCQEMTKLNKPDSVTNLSKDIDSEQKLVHINQKLTDIWDFVSRRRMTDSNVNSNAVKDMECIFELLAKYDEVWQQMREAVMLMSEEGGLDNQAQIDQLSLKLTQERVGRAKAKDQLAESQRSLSEVQDRLAETQSKLWERDKELVNLRRIKAKQDEKIKALEATNLHDQFQDKDKYLKAGTVKEIAKKIEFTITTGSTKFANRNQPVPLPGAGHRKGYVNPRFRKSKSQERWLNHKEKNEIPMGTLSQVNLKNKTETKNPEMKDLRKSDKYLLSHQNVTSDADVNMVYHKADIIPTAGGGVTVKYYEVETVTQKSPVDRSARKNKRRSSSFDCGRDSKRLRDEETY